MIELPKPTQPPVPDSEWLGNKSAEEIERIYREHETEEASQEVVRGYMKTRWLEHEADKLEPRRVLDVGCNDGCVSRLLLEKPYLDFWHGLVGIDLAKQAVDRARERAGRRASYFWGDFRAFDEEPGGFDMVVCFDLLEHFVPQVGVELLKFLNDQLKPAGTALLLTPTSFGVFGEKNPDRHHITFWSTKQIMGVLWSMGQCPEGPVVSSKDFVTVKWTKV